MGMGRGSFSAVDQPRRTLTSRMNSKDDKDGHRGNARLTRRTHGQKESLGC